MTASPPAASAGESGGDGDPKVRITYTPGALGELPDELPDDLPEELRDANPRTEEEPSEETPPEPGEPGR